MDTSDRPTNNNKPLKSILSVDGTTDSSTITSNNDSLADNNQKSIINNIVTINELTTTTTIKTSTEYLNGGGCSGSGNNGGSGGSNVVMGVCGGRGNNSNISSAGSSCNENNVILNNEVDGGDSGPAGIDFDKMAINENNKHQQIDKSNANDIHLNNSHNDICRQILPLNQSEKTVLKNGNRMEHDTVERCSSSEMGKLFGFFVNNLHFILKTNCLIFRELCPTY